MIEAPMGDARFFTRSGPHALADVASAGTALALKRMFAGVAPCGQPDKTKSAFWTTKRYAAALEQTMADAVIVHPRWHGFPAAR